jgi:hypothetical protein
MRYSIVFIALILIATGCKQDVQATDSKPLIKEVLVTDKTEVELLLDSIEIAHNKILFSEYEVVYFDILLEFGGKSRLDARLLMTTDSKKIRIDLKDGGVILYDGEHVFSSMESDKDKQARFDIFTWSYFFALPYKLSDAGIDLELVDYEKTHDKLYLTFDENTGDSPDDWYELYFNRESNLLDYAGYIVTYGGVDQAKASEDAHAISYENYNVVQNIPVSMEWGFYNYNNTISKEERIGKAVLSNVRFGKVDADLFNNSSYMHKVELP